MRTVHPPCGHTGPIPFKVIGDHSGLLSLLSTSLSGPGAHFVVDLHSRLGPDLAPRISTLFPVAVRSIAADLAHAAPSSPA